MFQCRLARQEGPSQIFLVRPGELPGDVANVAFGDFGEPPPVAQEDLRLDRGRQIQELAHDAHVVLNVEVVNRTIAKGPLTLEKERASLL